MSAPRLAWIALLSACCLQAQDAPPAKPRIAQSPLPSPEVTREHYAKSTDELQALAEEDLDARVDLGWRCLSGERTPLDLARGAELFRSAAEAGNPRGMMRLAQCLLRGLGVEQDVPRALEWYTKASAAGTWRP